MKIDRIDHLVLTVKDIEGDMRILQPCVGDGCGHF